MRDFHATAAAAMAMAMALLGCDQRPAAEQAAPAAEVSHAEASTMTFPVTKTDAEWRAELTGEQYRVLRGKDTERPFTGQLCSVKQPGTYTCAGCGQVLFKSGTKFDSGTGWPSYFDPVSPDAVVTVEDTSHSMVRTEVLCSRCGGHLGHVFNDGPPPSHLRYCINSAALKFIPNKDAAK